MSYGPGYADCNVPGYMAKYGAHASGDPHTGGSFWAEMDFLLKSGSAGIASGWFFEGRNGKRHLHFEFGSNQVYFKTNSGSYAQESPTVIVGGLNSGARMVVAIAAQSPRYRVFVNGTQVLDYTADSGVAPVGYALDCAADNDGSHGTLEVKGFQLYTLANG